MEIPWIAVYDQCGGWYWYSPHFENGWCAAVTDQSQASAPRRKTSYIASAICLYSICSVQEPFDSLADAKKAAVTFALEQKRARAGIWAP